MELIRMPQGLGGVAVRVLACVLLFAPVLLAQEGIYLLPGDPQEGMKVFLDKGCVRCHAVLGEGGKTAPDLGRTPAAHVTATQLVSMMWNHVPRMWERMEGEGISFPTFTGEEIEHLFAFLYSVRSLDAPGNPERGKQLLNAKGCVRCHKIGGVGGKIGPELTKGGWYVNPVQWAQEMWNHSETMEEAMREQGMAWPRFEGEDMADLLSYIRSVSPPSESRRYPLSVDPKAGAELFAAKGCQNCHPIRGSGGRAAPDLGKKTTAFPRTLAQFAGLMWNHAPQMRREMRQEGIERPEFSNREMSDLIAYLYAVRYFEEPGDPIAGRKVFAEKRCGQCNLKGESGSMAPDLSRWAGHISPVMMARAVWNHGPAMRKEIKQAGISWPTFAGPQMADLIAYLNEEGRAGR